MLFALGILTLPLEKWNDLPIALWCSALTPLTGLIWYLRCNPSCSSNPCNSACLFCSESSPPAVLNFMVAERYNQEPAKVASMVLISNMASAIVIPIAPVAVAGVLRSDFQRG